MSCDGESLDGIVVQDELCGANPKAYIVDIGRHHEWIMRNSSESKKLSFAVIFMTFYAYWVFS